MILLDEVLLYFILLAQQTLNALHSIALPLLHYKTLILVEEVHYLSQTSSPKELL
jgi:hypothetical protein